MGSILAPVVAAVARPALAAALTKATPRANVDLSGQIGASDDISPLPDSAYGYTGTEKHLDALFSRPGMVPTAKDPPRHCQIDLGLDAQEMGYAQRLGHGWTAGGFVRNDDENGVTVGARFDRRW
jgi:hypothetical protein